jgi:hypothetical protein
MKLRILPKTRLEVRACIYAALQLATMVLALLVMLLVFSDFSWRDLVYLVFIFELVFAFLTIGTSFAAFSESRERPLSFIYRWASVSSASC